jgi:tetratricopeptide (TPR) repeat protein
MTPRSPVLAMPPESRALLAVLCLGIFGWTLAPRAAPAGRSGDPEVERLLVASRSAYESRHWQSALAPTAALVERFPNQQVFAERLARTHAGLGQPADEAAAWERFLRVSPTPEDACPAVADAYWRAGDRAQSLAASIRCRDFDPLNGELHYYLGRAYERAGKPGEARAAYEAALRVEPTHVDTRVALAGMLLREGQPARALDVIELPVNPDHTDVLLMAGIAYQRLGRRAEARTALERAAALDPAYVDVHLVLGVLDFSEGHLAAARRRFEQVSQLDPSRRDVDVWLARTKGIS